MGDRWAFFFKLSYKRNKGCCRKWQNMWHTEIKWRGQVAFRKSACAEIVLQGRKKCLETNHYGLKRKCLFFSRFLIYERSLWTLFANSVREYSSQTLSFLTSTQLSEKLPGSFLMTTNFEAGWPVIGSDFKWMLQRLWCLLCELEDKQYNEKRRRSLT